MSDTELRFSLQMTFNVEDSERFAALPESVQKLAMMRMHYRARTAMINICALNERETERARMRTFQPSNVPDSLEEDWPW